MEQRKTVPSVQSSTQGDELLHRFDEVVLLKNAQNAWDKIAVISVRQLAGKPIRVQWRAGGRTCAAFILSGPTRATRPSMHHQMRRRQVRWIRQQHRLRSKPQAPIQGQQRGAHCQRSAWRQRVPADRSASVGKNLRLPAAAGDRRRGAAARAISGTRAARAVRGPRAHLESQSATSATGSVHS